MNGLYDWGWLRTDGGIADAAVRSARRDRRARDPGRREPAQIQPRRALRALRSARQGRGAAAASGRGRGLRARARRSTPRSTSGNCRRAMSAPMPKPMRSTRSRCSRSSTRSWIGKARATPIGSKSICCRWCSRCAGAASASIRTPPSRRAIYLLANAMPRSPSFRHSIGAPVGMDEINSRKWKEQTFDALRHQLSAHRERQPVVHGRQIGMDGEHEHWLPRLNRDREQIRCTPAASFSKGISSTTSSTGASTPRSTRSARRTAARVVALLLFQSAAAADAVARQGDRAADPQRVPAGGRRGLGQARHLAAGISLRRALRRAAQAAGRAGGGRGLPQRSRRRLPRHGRAR